jgi:hypothetical protein
MCTLHGFQRHVHSLVQWRRLCGGSRRTVPDCLDAVIGDGLLEVQGWARAVWNAESFAVG